MDGLLATKGHGDVCFGCLPEAMPWAVVPMKLQESVLMSVAPVTTKDPVENQSLGHHL